MAQRLGEPISRGFVSDVDLVVSLLSPTQPTPESELYSLLRDRMDGPRIERAVNEAQSQNLIRWVAFSGWCRDGRPV